MAQSALPPRGVWGACPALGYSEVNSWMLGLPFLILHLKWGQSLRVSKLSKMIGGGGGIPPLPLYDTLAMSLILS